MLLDSNLIIYATRPERGALRAFIAEHAPKVSVVSKVETLGYHRLSYRELRRLTAFFEAAEVLGVSNAVVDAAIQLRQQRKMTLGDALIAGTALTSDLRVATHNTQDFEWIDELDVIDPLSDALP